MLLPGFDEVAKKIEKLRQHGASHAIDVGGYVAYFAQMNKAAGLLNVDQRQGCKCPDGNLLQPSIAHIAKASRVLASQNMRHRAPLWLFGVCL